jgi:hypothetical protein
VRGRVSAHLEGDKGGGNPDLGDIMLRGRAHIDWWPPLRRCQLRVGGCDGDDWGGASFAKTTTPMAPLSSAFMAFSMKLHPPRCAKTTLPLTASLFAGGHAQKSMGCKCSSECHHARALRRITSASTRVALTRPDSENCIPKLAGSARTYPGNDGTLLTVRNWISLLLCPA